MTETTISFVSTLSHLDDHPSSFEKMKEDKTDSEKKDQVSKDQEKDKEKDKENDDNDINDKERERKRGERERERGIEMEEFEMKVRPVPSIQPTIAKEDERYLTCIIKSIHENEYPREPYRARQEAEKQSILHWGQRKLLLSELFFLTLYGHLSKHIIYAGAASGTHIIYLSTKLFPHHQFYLYDPAPFNPHLKSCSNVKIFEEYFTIDRCKKLYEQFQGDCLFISDIRTADHRKMSEEENEECINKDNQWQMEWIQILQPYKSMIKFRLPYPDRVREQSMKYLKGYIFLQQWARRSGTETRLIVDRQDITNDVKAMHEYSYLVYEQELFWFNEKARKCTIRNPFADMSIGFGHYFDAYAEGQIIANYLLKNTDLQAFQRGFDKSNIAPREVINMVLEINNSLNASKDALLKKQNTASEYVNKCKDRDIDHQNFHTYEKRYKERTNNSEGNGNNEVKQEEEEEGREKGMEEYHIPVLRTQESNYTSERRDGYRSQRRRNAYGNNPYQHQHQRQHQYQYQHQFGSAKRKRQQFLEDDYQFDDYYEQARDEVYSNNRHYNGNNSYSNKRRRVDTKE